MMPVRKDNEELTVITKTYDFILWSCHHTGKFPRNHRFVLGERIERNLYDLLELLIRAKYSRNRQEFLEQANLVLAEVREQIRAYLVRLRLVLHPKKCAIFAVADGIRFLGYRVFPTHRLLPKENVHRFRRRVRAMEGEYAAGRMSFAEVHQRLMSWSGHARQANTYRLRCRLFDTIHLQRATTE